MFYCKVLQKNRFGEAPLQYKLNLYLFSPGLSLFSMRKLWQGRLTLSSEPCRAFHNFCRIPSRQRSNPIKVSNAIMLILPKNDTKLSGINVTRFSSIPYCRISEIAFVFKTKKVFDIKFSSSVWVMWPSINIDIVTKCIRHNTNSKSTCYVWGLTWTVNLDYLSTVQQQMVLLRTRNFFPLHKWTSFDILFKLYIRTLEV